MGTKLTALTTKRSQYVINVWLVRMWEGPPEGNGSEGGAWEMLFHDFKGNRVHCTLPVGVIMTFKPILSEGRFYSLSNFLVVKNRLWMKSSLFEYRIILMQRSCVLLILQPLFPFKPFVFQSIASIINEESLQENVLFDVLAKVIGKEDPKEMVTKHGTNSKRIGLRVKDADKTSINCTLFGGLVDRIKPYIEEQKGEPLIVALRLFPVREWNESTIGAALAVMTVTRNAKKWMIISIVISALKPLKSVKKALEKKMLLRINIKSGNISRTEYVYNVSKPSLDQHLIKKHFIKQVEPVGKAEDLTASIGTSFDVIPLGSLDSVPPGQDSVNESKTVTNSKTRGRRIDSGVLGEVAIE
ncbi:hypothetical protein PIB30_016118 [Stylosanthes scabra]|uniref:Replication protein A 70 kDa DNA-binding subunit B/D first OB fold domain-containing protein n=1 Tax=Stylosanthes scabra TaxID=79078 RepID=A0ABU6R7I9_9FABA|nr:hypothetical protein [Stylosanthes scabra]